MTDVASADRRRPLEFAPINGAEARRHRDACLALTRRRRSLRHPADLPVDRTLIENALEAAASAPSGANQQPWRFVVAAAPKNDPAGRQW